MHADVPWFTLFIVSGAVGAALFDLATRRVPNWLTAAVLVIALAYHGAHGVTEFLQSAGIAAVVVVAGTYLHARHWLGGGDVKLAAALGAGLAFPAAMDFLVYTLLSGGILAAAALVVTHRRTLLARTAAFVARLIAGTVSLPRAGALGSLRIPYAVAMAGGAALAALAISVPVLRLV